MAFYGKLECEMVETKNNRGHEYKINPNKCILPSLNILATEFIK